MSANTTVIAVTGADGLIGRATVAALTAQGLTVRGYAGPDHLRRTSPQGALPELPADAFVWGSLTDPDVLARAFDGASVVIHLAGPPSVVQSFADPTGAVTAHAAGTAAVVQAALRQGNIGRIVVASSAEVYGIPETERVAEDHPLRPLSPYAAAKVGAEAVARALTAPLGVELALLRPFAVYGSTSPDWSLVGGAMRQAMTHGPVTMQSLERVRDLTHVSDVAAAFVAAATRSLSRQCIALNVCTGTATSVAELAQTALRVAGSTAEIRQGANRAAPTRAELLGGARPAESDPFRLVGDPSLAAQELGWRAATDLTSGLVGLMETLRAAE